LTITTLTLVKQSDELQIKMATGRSSGEGRRSLSLAQSSIAYDRTSVQRHTTPVVGFLISATVLLTRRSSILHARTLASI